MLRINPGSHRVRRKNANSVLCSPLNLNVYDEMRQRRVMKFGCFWISWQDSLDKKNYILLPTGQLIIMLSAVRSLETKTHLLNNTS